MSQALVMRDRSIHLTDAEKLAATRALEQGLRGVDEKNDKRWRRFLRKLFSLEDGEVAEVGTRVPRSGPFHRYHMAIEQAVFNAQDRFTQFEMFRNWVKIGAGHVEWVPGAKGGIVPLPKSIGYADLEEPEMREFHDAMLAFLRGAHAAPYLWKHLPSGEAAAMVEAVLSEFDR
jgi:hypothetical protein